MPATFAEKSRKLLRKIFMFAGAGCISLLFQACYGVIEDSNYDEITISGRVRCKETQKPIPGINVTIQSIKSDTAWDRTSAIGYFVIFVPKEDARFTIEFEDVDEEYNEGWFLTKTEEIEVSKNKRQYDIDIFLDKISE